MNDGRRPVTDDERPHLVELGRHLRALRDEVGVTQAVLGKLATLSAEHVGALERGQRRTRRSTLERLIAALVPEHRRDAVLDELAEVAGPALAPESDYAERVERRRRRREAHDLAGAIEATKAAIASTRRLLRVSPHRAADLADLEEDLRRQLEELERRAAETARPSDESSRRRPGVGPAKAALDDFIREITGGQRSGTLRLTDDQAARLAELKAAADAERNGSR